MSAVEAVKDEMATHLRTLAEPRPVGDSVKAAIARVSRLIRRPYGRTKRLWYREVDAITAPEADHIRQCAEERRCAEIKRLHAQLETLAVMRQDNRDALVEDARKLLGPLYDRLVAVGLLKLDGVETPKDGET